MLKDQLLATAHAMDHRAGGWAKPITARPAAEFADQVLAEPSDRGGDERWEPHNRPFVPWAGKGHILPQPFLPQHRRIEFSASTTGFIVPDEVIQPYSVLDGASFALYTWLR